MSLIRILILVVAAGAALVAALMVRSLSSQPEPAPVIVEAAAPEPLSTLRVLVATRDLVLGERVTPEDFAWQPWPEDAVNPAFFNDESSTDAMVDLAGSFVRSEILSGEPVTQRKLVQPGSSSFMAAVLTPGMRAIAAEISVETAAGGFILPNDRVDVILTREVEIDNGQTVTEATVSETVLQNVRVLAIDQTFGDVGDGETILPSTATLELTPEESEILALAQEMGEIALALRSVADARIDMDAQRRAGELSSSPNLSGNVKIYKSGKASSTAVGGMQ